LPGFTTDWEALAGSNTTIFFGFPGEENNYAAGSNAGGFLSAALAR
jgi:hypothetical protein